MKLLLSFLTATIAAWPAATMVSLRIAPAQASLKGASATQQFVAIAKYADGTERDVTDASRVASIEPVFSEVHLHWKDYATRGRNTHSDCWNRNE